MKHIMFEHFDIDSNEVDREGITMDLKGSEFDIHELTDFFRRFMLAIGYVSFEGQRLEMVPDDENEHPDAIAYRDGYEDAAVMAKEEFDRIVCDLRDEGTIGKEDAAALSTRFSYNVDKHV